MSITLPNNYARLAGNDPAVAAALERFAEFVASHPKWDSIDFRTVTRAMPDIDPLAMARAIHALVENGVLRQLYSVTTPSGSLTNEKFERPSQIPAKLPDRFNEYFETAEQDVVPVLVAAKR